MPTIRRRHRRRRRASHRLMPSFACIALIFTLFGPIGLVAAAQSGEDPSATPFVEDAGTPPSDETLLVEEADPGRDASNVVRAIAMACPAGTDPAASQETLFDTCDSPLGGVGFTLSDATGPHLETTDASGSAGFADVIYPDTGATLTETFPIGYGQPVVFCSEGDTPNYGPVDNVNGTVTLLPSVTDGVFMSCVFFSFPLGGDVETGTVHISKYFCPEGTERSDDDYALSEACRVEAAPVSFEVSDSAGADIDVTTTAGVPQHAEVNGLAFGEVWISEIIPDGYGEPLVFCSDTPADGAGNYEPVTVSGGNSVSWDLRADAEIPLTCLFFNFPKEDGGEGGDVHLSKYTCPAGYEPLEDDYLMSEQCREEIDPVTFSIIGPGDFFQEQVATAGVPQNATFTSVPFGTIEISEVIPDGYGSPLVFCTDTPADGPGAYEPALGLDGNTFSWEHREDAEIDLSCVVFNFEDADGGDVHIAKYACPAGVERTDDFYALSETCLEDIDPVQFTVTATAGGYEETLTADPGVPQSALFENVPYGEIAIGETAPDGYGWPLVFCADTQADGPGAYVPVKPWPESGSFIVDHRAEANLDLTCLFFNFPDDEDGGDVHLSKYFCPGEVDESADWPVLADQCTDSGPAVEFTVTVPTAGYHESATTSGDSPQTATFMDVPYGTLYLEETLPAGYVWPRVFCTDTFSDGMGNFEELIAGAESEAGAFTWEHGAGAETDLRCIVFNFPDDPGNTVTVNKYMCPPGVNPETDILLDVCVPGGDGIHFDFVDGNGIHPAAVTGGKVAWTGVVIGAEGELQIIEEIPAGFGDPLVNCDGIRMESTNGFVIPQPGDERPFHIECDWFNFALEDSSITVIKYTCPPGYVTNADDAAAADPMIDCTELTDGVPFHIGGPGADATLTTGVSGTGEVTFDGLGPGDYTLTEMAPDGAAFSFVGGCVGNAVGSVRPFPLATGDTLNLTVYGGEDITCHWYNVPEREHASITVQKFTCATTTFASTVDCEVYEGGQAFDLMFWDGRSWDYVDTLTTDGYGVATFEPLEPGQYWVVEPDGEWCHLESPGLSDNGNWLEVTADEPTVVLVYNCDGDPGKPGKTPTKYPNTGVPPTEGEGLVPSTSASSPASLPFMALSGLLGVALTRRRLVALAVPATVVVAGTTLAQDDQVIEPREGTPDDAAASTPASLCLPATPAGEGTPEVDCARGPVPAQLQIEAIGVDAPIEILETVGGVMQQPSDEAHVAWYKETARLGETGNLLLAGHVNWWGVPEAVFFHLGTLQEGDGVVLRDAEGTAYHYAIEWVRQESNLEPPREEVLGMTSYEAVTLMTCSGEWNSELSEYDSRTVARAKRVPTT